MKVIAQKVVHYIFVHESLDSSFMDYLLFLADHIIMKMISVQLYWTLAQHVLNTCSINSVTV